MQQLPVWVQTTGSIANTTLLGSCFCDTTLEGLQRQQLEDSRSKPYRTLLLFLHSLVLPMFSNRLLHLQNLRGAATQVVPYFYNHLGTITQQHTTYISPLLQTQQALNNAFYPQCQRIGQIQHQKRQTCEPERCRHKQPNFLFFLPPSRKKNKKKIHTDTSPLVLPPSAEDLLRKADLN